MVILLERVSALHGVTMGFVDVIGLEIGVIVGIIKNGKRGARRNDRGEKRRLLSVDVL